ncbi:MAG: hypothetical protein WC269_02425 [Candidatus Gracilibacteria bacterium]|jgi:hypothetical protein
MTSSFKTHHKYPRGATLVISLGLAMVMIITALGVAKTILNTAKNIKTFKNASQAQMSALSLTEVLKLTEADGGGYLARAGSCNDAIDNVKDIFGTITCGSADSTDCEEIAFPDDNLREIVRDIPNEPLGGNLANPTQPITQQYTGTDPSADSAVSPPLELSFSCEVVGVAPEKLAYESQGAFYVLPSPGQGTAIKRCTSPTASTDLNDSCNWNLLSFDSPTTSTVVVPLFYRQSADTNSPVRCNGGDDGICDFSDSTADGQDGDKKIILRVRTPCADQNADGTCAERYKFDAGDGKNKPRQNNTVMYWSISAEGKTLLPVDDTDSYGFRKPLLNSEIYESEINEANNGEVWSTDDRGQEPNKTYVSPDLPPLISEWLATVTKPTLQFILVAPDMKSTTTGKNIPKFEYQILSRKPISTPDTIYHVQVNYMNQSYGIIDRVPRPGGVFNYTIQN